MKAGQKVRRMIELKKMREGSLQKMAKANARINKIEKEFFALHKSLSKADKELYAEQLLKSVW